MKIAVSNLAWPRSADEDVAEMLAASKIGGIEIAPSKIWADPTTVTEVEAKAYRRFWADRGIRIVAAQSLLYGHPELTLFESAESRRNTLEYLKRIFSLCASLGAKSLVFGSPKNRRVGGLDPDTAWSIAFDFFSELAESAERTETMVVLEANPPQYGADFVTSAQQAFEMVQAVARPGLRLHLDTACMTMAGDRSSDIPRYGCVLSHFHVSESALAPIGAGTVDHEAFAAELNSCGYSGWVSIEMLESPPFDLEVIRRVVSVVQRTYG